jgi:acetyltransferase
MAPSNGVELIVGGNTVEGLGKTVLVGLGGIYVEVFKDISLGFAPLSQEFALQMIQRLSSFALLNGARGQAKFDVDALCQSLGKISALLIDHPEIKELDINPLLVLPTGEGVRVLDARILL